MSAMGQGADAYTTLIAVQSSPLSPACTMSGMPHQRRWPAAASSRWRAVKLSLQTAAMYCMARITHLHSQRLQDIRDFSSAFQQLLYLSCMDNTQKNERGEGDLVCHTARFRVLTLRARWCFLLLSTTMGASPDLARCRSCIGFLPLVRMFTRLCAKNSPSTVLTYVGL